MKIPKINRKSEYFGFSFIFMGNIGGGAIGGLTWLFLASIMQVSDYGEISFYMSLGSVVGIVAGLGTNTTLLTFIPKEKDTRIFYQAASLVLISSSIAAVIVSFINFYSALLVLGISYFTLTTNELLGNFRHKEFAALIILESLARFGLVILLLHIMGPFGIILGYAITAIAFSYRFFQTSKHFTFKFDIIRSKIQFSAYSWGTNILSFLPTLLDKSIIIWLFGETTLGFYALAMQFISLASISSLSLYQYMLPKKSSGMKLKSLLLGGFILSIFISLLILFFSPFVIETFFTNFKNAKNLVQIVGFSIIPSSLAAMINSILLAKEQPRIVFFSWIAYIISLITGLIFLGQQWNVIGLGVAFLLAQSFQVCFLITKTKFLRGFWT